MDEKDLQDLKPFAQKPYWNPDAKIELTGAEFEVLAGILQPFIPAGFIMQSIFDRSIKEGTIKMKYEYTDGSGEVTEAEVKALTERFMKMMEDQKNTQPESTEIVTEDNVKPLNKKKSKIITEI
jgi:hypothetical protein